MTEPQVAHRDEQPYVGITRRVTMDRFDQVTDRFPEIFEWLDVRGVEPAGAPFFRYHVIDMERELEVEAGVPVPPGSAVPATDEEVTAGVLPAGRYVTLIHVGHPDRLVGVTGDLLAWAEREGLVFDRHDTDRGDAWASRVEFYRTDPSVEPDMNRWEVELAFKLADQG